MEKKKDLKFLIIAMTAQGKGISGGDKISIELSRRWAKLYPVTIYLWEEGLKMYKRQNFTDKEVNFKVIDMKPWKYLGFHINYIALVLSSIFLSLFIKLENKKEVVVYSASDFWMDSLPAVIIKIRFPKITWVATWFQTAPNPFIGFKEGDRKRSYRFSALKYWFVQQPIKPLIKKYADFVLVNNEAEKKQFPQMNKKKRMKVAFGGVDCKSIELYVKHHPLSSKIYDGVFQGRFHPQKGIVELLDIWKLVVNKKTNAKLALIGDGPLMREVKDRIEILGLKKNIKLLGYIFNNETKYRIFQQSRVVLHPAFYDSGGMASAEAMAFGLPAVGFNLVSYKSYYPKGMIKVKINDLKGFAKAVIKLLSNSTLYSKIGSEAKEMIEKGWSWDKKAYEILNYLS